ncbi:MAG TPA: cytochrome P450 [Acidimicrobiales bacterium]|nr:cytochrome P450 [Acidimicrobiales bacterium]
MSDTSDVEFDPFSSEYFDDPYDTYRRLRDHRPVYFNATYGFYALSRWDDVVDASRNWRVFSSAYGVDLATLTSHKRPGMDSLIMIDPPQHDRLRALVSRVFTPRAVTALEPMVREVVTGCLDALDGRRAFDVVEDLSGPFPVEIICRMLGVPAGERQQIRHWLDVVLARDEGQMGYSEAGTAAAVEMGAYFYGLVAEKRAHPTDDMITRLTQVEVADDDGALHKLDDVEIAGFVSLLGGAGAETVTKAVGNAAVLFDRHPEQWQLVLDDRSRIPDAVEEILRYHPPSQYQGRYAVEDITLHGETIPANNPVLLVTGAAARDERQFDDPDRFDVTRPPNLALALGHGVHACLGAALARMECRIALEELAERYPRFTVDADGLERVHMSNVAGYSKVPITIG